MYIHDSIQQIPVSKWLHVAEHVNIETGEITNAKEAERNKWLRINKEQKTTTEIKIINNTYVKYGYKTTRIYYTDARQLRLL